MLKVLKIIYNGRRRNYRQHTLVPIISPFLIFTNPRSARLISGPDRKGRSSFPKVYYATQISVNPVTILMFVNNPALFEENYRRFIVGRLRTLLPIREVPIRLLAKPHRELKSSRE